MNKMSIQKKGISQFIKILLIIFLLFLITSCKKRENLTQEDFRFIKAGMTISKIQRKLGKPNEIYKGKEKIESLLQEDAENSTDMWESRDKKIYQKFFSSSSEDKAYDKIDNFYKKSKTIENIICYEYTYYYTKSSSTKWHIYFIDDRVAWMYFP